jgi:hypothetical protein
MLQQVKNLTEIRSLLVHYADTYIDSLQTFSAHDNYNSEGMNKRCSGLDDEV